MPKKLLPIAFFALFVASIVQTGIAHAASFSASEVKLKIVLLYNFAKFINWPEQRFSESNAPVTLCIYAEEQYAKAAQGVHGKPVQKKRTIAVTAISDESNIDSCHILFISQSTIERIGKIPESATASSVVTVGETKEFIQHGGIINLIEINKKIRFEINLKSAKNKSLKISSKLLRLAKEVY